MADVRRLPVRAAAVFAVVLGLASTFTATYADQPSSVTWRIDGRDVTSIDANDPLRMHPDRGARVEVTVANDGDKELDVRSVRIDGRVVRLTFFSYVTRIDMILPPGTHATRSFDLDLTDLDGQAVGLIPSRIQLLSPQRTVLAERPMAVDVRGSLRSVYGVFGLAVAGITLALLVGLLRALATRRLPANRWQRAQRFLPVGAGLGLTLTFTLSATRLLLPSARDSAMLVTACAAIAFVLGYFSPSPVLLDDETPVEPSGAITDVSNAGAGLPIPGQPPGPVGASDDSRHIVVLPHPTDETSESAGGDAP